MAWFTNAHNLADFPKEGCENGAIGPYRDLETKRKYEKKKRKGKRVNA